MERVNGEHGDVGLVVGRGEGQPVRGELYGHLV